MDFSSLARTAKPWRSCRPASLCSFPRISISGFRPQPQVRHLRQEEHHPQAWHLRPEATSQQAWHLRPEVQFRALRLLVPMTMVIMVKFFAVILLPKITFYVTLLNMQVQCEPGHLRPLPIRHLRLR